MLTAVPFFNSIFSLNTVNGGVALAKDAMEDLLYVLVKGMIGRLLYLVASVLSKGMSQGLHVGVAVHLGTALVLLCYQMHHTVGGTVKEIVVNRVVGSRILIAPALDVGRRVDVVSLLSPAVA